MDDDDLTTLPSPPSALGPGPSVVDTVATDAHEGLHAPIPRFGPIHSHVRSVVSAIVNVDRGIRHV